MNSYGVKLSGLDARAAFTLSAFPRAAPLAAVRDILMALRELQKNAVRQSDRKQAGTELPLK